MRVHYDYIWDQIGPERFSQFFQPRIRSTAGFRPEQAQRVIFQYHQKHDGGELLVFEDEEPAFS